MGNCQRASGGCQEQGVTDGAIWEDCNWPTSHYAQIHRRVGCKEICRRKNT